MIAAFLYKYIYLFLVTILTLVAYNRYSTKGGLQEYRYVENEVSNWILVIFLILFIGFRPVSGWYFVDMANYYTFYNALYDGVEFNFNWHTDNIIFDNLFAWWGSVRLGIRSFFIFNAAIYFGCAYLGIRRIFPNHKLAAYLVFLAAFSTFSYGTNGIKAGAGASLFIWAYSYRQNLTKCIPLILLSYGFHHSMQLPVAAFVLSLFYKNPKLYFSAWVLCLLLAMLHISFFQELFGGMSDEQGASYLMTNSETEQDGTKGGFRIDFILYSAMPVLVGYYAVIKKKLQISNTYRELLHLYLCTNGIWMLCMYASFTNRIAYLSWFIYPIVLIYPFLYEEWGWNKYKMFSKVMLVHLVFTLFMELIYYAK